MTTELTTFKLQEQTIADISVTTLALLWGFTKLADSPFKGGTVDFIQIMYMCDMKKARVVIVILSFDERVELWTERNLESQSLKCSEVLLGYQKWQTR